MRWRDLIEPYLAWRFSKPIEPPKRHLPRKRWLPRWDVSGGYRWTK